MKFNGLFVKFCCDLPRYYIHACDITSDIGIWTAAKRTLI